MLEDRELGDLFVYDSMIHVRVCVCAQYSRTYETVVFSVF